MTEAPRPENGTTRSTSATISPNILRYLDQITEEYGVDLKPELARVGLTETLMRSAALHVSYRQGSAVIRRAVELTGDENLGLRVGAAQHLTAWGLVGFAMLASDTLQVAIEAGVRFQNVSGAMTVWSAGREGSGYVVRADLPDPMVDPNVAVFLVEEAFSSVVTLGRLAADAGLAPQEVHFAFAAPRDVQPFHDLFRCPLHFGASHNRLVVPQAWINRPMPGRDPVTYASALELLEGQMASRRRQQDLLEILEISVAQSLPAVPSFSEQARIHASSERTLRRRLAGCGTSYEAIVDGVRRERVEQLLHRPHLTLREVARQAGFSDERALRRAVRRWHGMAPLQLREGFSSETAGTTPSQGRGELRDQP
ncbi:AraC family transcriptional regulator [Streptomyces canus]|uniref:AraC family transcriptional regulator n=1 Tax=Streptomyces canus TaxID=58343 RepID=UPI0003614AAC|nr:AraC family transcriptional regulator [Streptomyces canus]